MSVKAKLILEDKVINLLSFEFSFNQGVNALGKPSGKVVFLGLRLVIEAEKDLGFSEWAMAENQARQIELHIYPIIMGGRIHKFYFYDCHLLQWVNNFSSTGDKPTSELLHISAAGVKDSFFDTEYSAHWRKTFPTENSNESTDKETLKKIKTKPKLG